MCFARSAESRKMEMEEFKEMLQAAVCAVGHSRWRKDEEDFNGLLTRVSSTGMDDVGEKLVCVTSGASFLGLALVQRLLSRGYSIRIILDNEEDTEQLRELENSEEIITSGGRSINVVPAKVTEIESLMEAFEGCRGVFHTSAFTDPAGLSGYTKSMAEMEAKASENVIEACSRTPSVRRCVLTSSLLACIWRDGTLQDLSPVINHNSWSNESLCIDKKLWYALGKVRAEKAAWRIAKEKGLKLAAICPGLITGPEFLLRNPTATIGYLKGAQEMFAHGLLATVDVMKLAEAHVCVFEAMTKTASGRYICFDRVIETEAEVEKLAKETEMPVNKIYGNASNQILDRFELSNKKLLSLMSRTLRDCCNQR